MTDNPLRRPSSTDELRLASVLFDTLREASDWPVVDFVIGTLAREGLDFGTIITGLSPPCQHYGFLYMNHLGAPQRTDRIGLTLAGLAQVPSADRTVDLVLRVIRELARQYDDIPLDPRVAKELRVDWVGIARIVSQEGEQLNLRDVNSTLSVLAAEPAGWGASVLGMEPGEDSWDVNSSIARFLGVGSIDDYLDRVYDLLRPSVPVHQTGPSRASADPSVTGVSLSVNDLHPLVIASVGDRLEDGYANDGIFNAFKMVEVTVRQVAGVPATEVSVMNKAFGGSTPRVWLTRDTGELRSKEHSGWMHLFMGAQEAVRNEGAHRFVDEQDPERALEYLALASLLLRRLDEVIT